MALITGAAIVMSLPIPMWTATRTLLAVQSTHTLFRWTAILLAYAFSAILPLFYFALSRHDGTLRFSKHARFACIVGAIAGVIVMAAGLPEWLDTSRPAATTVKMLLSDFATLACVLLLIALFRQTTGPCDPISRLLSVMTRVAVIAGGIWMAFNLVALILRPGRGAIRTVLEQACLFTAPYVVYSGAPRRS